MFEGNIVKSPGLWQIAISRGRMTRRPRGQYPLISEFFQILNKNVCQSVCNKTQEYILFSNRLKDV